MRLLVSGFCVPVGLLVAAVASAQPSAAPPSSYGDRQAGHFGDPGAGYFGNAGDGTFGSQSLDVARARAAGDLKTGAGRNATAPSPYIVIDPTLKPKAAKPAPAAAPTPSN